MDLDLKSYLAMATGEDLIRTIMSEDFPDDLVILDWSDKASSAIMEPKSFGDKFFLDSVMDFSKTLLLSKQILNQDTIEIKVDYMVSIDSNVIGHIVSDIFKNRSNNQALIEAINYVTEKRMRIDVNPYLIETQLNRYELNKYDIHKSLQALETLDVYDPSKDGTIAKAYERDKLAILQGADMRFSNISNDIYLGTPIIKYYTLAYILLLKTFLIKNTYANNTNKIDDLIDFIIEEIPILAENEIITSVLYLNNNRHLERFLNVKENTKNKLGKLSGMAWDLSHIRYIEMIMELEYGKFDSLKIPYLLTGDKGLSSLIRFNPVRRILILEQRPIFIRKHNLNNINLTETQIEKLKVWLGSERPCWDSEVQRKINHRIKELEEQVDSISA